MFTDGAIEMKGPDGKRLSLPGLIEVMNSLGTGHVRTLYPRLVDRLVTVNGHENFADDLTLVLLQHTVPDRWPPT